MQRRKPASENGGPNRHGAAAIIERYVIFDDFRFNVLGFILRFRLPAVYGCFVLRPVILLCYCHYFCLCDGSCRRVLRFVDKLATPVVVLAHRLGCYLSSFHLCICWRLRWAAHCCSPWLSLSFGR